MRAHLGIAGVLAVLSTPALGLTAEEKCHAGKLAIAGKRFFCLLSEQSKSVKTGNEPNFAKCAAKYWAKWVTVESNAAGQCPVTGDNSAISGQAHAFFEELAASIGGGTPAAVSGAEKCQAGKLKTAGKLVFCRLKAAAKAVKAGQPADFTKCDEKYGAKWAAIESSAAGQCPVNGDQIAIQMDVTEFCEDVAAAIGGNTVSRFVDNADGTITDTATSLMWEKKTERDDDENLANLHDADNAPPWSGVCSIGGKLCQPTATAAALCAANVEGDPDGCAECLGGEGTCNGSTTVWTMAAALNTANFAGHSDWRVPSGTELEGIRDLDAVDDPAIDVAFHGVDCGATCTDITSAACSCTQDSSYWSASTYLAFSDAAITVPFLVGGTTDANTKDINGGGYIRFVREAS
jgi:hypothetical protein